MAFGNRSFGGRDNSRGDSNRGGFRRSFRRFPREMTKIKCSNCGKEDEVPFKPSGDRPVYCRECFMKMKGSEPSNSKDNTEEKKSEDEGEEMEEIEESLDEQESEDEEDSEEDLK